MAVLSERRTTTMIVANALVIERRRSHGGYFKGFLNPTKIALAKSTASASAIVRKLFWSRWSIALRWPWLGRYSLWTVTTAEAMKKTPVVIVEAVTLHQWGTVDDTKFRWRLHANSWPWWFSFYSIMRSQQLDCPPTSLSKVNFLFIFKRYLSIITYAYRKQIDSTRNIYKVTNNIDFRQFPMLMPLRNCYYMNTCDNALYCVVVCKMYLLTAMAMAIEKEKKNYL